MSEFLNKLNNGVFLTKKTILMSAGNGYQKQPVTVFHTITPLRNKQHPYSAESLSQDYRYCLDDKRLNNASTAHPHHHYGNIIESLKSQDFPSASITTRTSSAKACPNIVDNPFSYANGNPLVSRKAERPHKDDKWHPCFSETFSLMRSPHRAVVISIRSINAFDSDLDGLSTFKGSFAFAASVCDPDEPWMCHNFMFIFVDNNSFTGSVKHKAYQISTNRFIPYLNELIAHIFVEADLFRHIMVHFGRKGYFKNSKNCSFQPAPVVLLLDNAPETLASLTKLTFTNGFDEEGIDRYQGDPLYKNLYAYRKDIIVSERNGFPLVSHVDDPVTGQTLSSNYYLFGIHMRTPKVLASKKDWKMEHICRELSLPMPQPYDTTLNSAIHCWFDDPDRFLRSEWELTQLPLEYVSWIFGPGFIPPTTIVSMTNTVSTNIMRNNFHYTLPTEHEEWKLFHNYVTELNFRGFYYPNPHDTHIPRPCRTQILNGFNFHAETTGTAFAEIEPVSWYRKAYGGGLNTCYIPGHITEKTYDYDIASAYPVALSLIPDVQWFSNPFLGAFQNNDPNDDFYHKGREETSTTYTKVQYDRLITYDDLKEGCAQIFYCRADFPDDCYQPNFRESVEKVFHGTKENGYIFPLHTTFAVRTQYEVRVALNMGAHVYVKNAIEIPYIVRDDGTHQYTGRDILKVYMRDRFKAQQESCNSSIFKLAANSQYGKMAQDVSNFSGRVNNCYNAIANPYLVANATSLVRSVLAEAVTEVHRLGYRVYSATTDGFITNAPKHIIDTLELGGLRRAWESVLAELSNGVITDMWSQKHQQDEFLNVTTRFNVALNEDGVCAHGSIGSYPHVKNDSTIDRIHTWNQAVVSNGLYAPVVQVRQVSFDDVGNFRIPYFRYLKIVRGHINFDGKRRPLFHTAHYQNVPTITPKDIVGDHHPLNGHNHMLSFDTRPWDHVDDYIVAKQLFTQNDPRMNRRKGKKTSSTPQCVEMFSNLQQLASAFAYFSVSTRRKTLCNSRVLLDAFIENLIAHCIQRDNIFWELPFTKDDEARAGQLCQDINDMVGSTFATCGRWSRIKRLLNSGAFVPLDKDVERVMINTLVAYNCRSNNLVADSFGLCNHSTSQYSRLSQWYTEHFFPGAHIDKENFSHSILYQLSQSAFATPNEIQADFLSSDYWQAVISEILKNKSRNGRRLTRSVSEEVMKRGFPPEVLQKVHTVRKRQARERANILRRREEKSSTEYYRKRNIPCAWETPFSGAMNNQNIIRAWRKRVSDNLSKEKLNGATEERLIWLRNQEVYSEWAQRVLYKQQFDYAANKDVYMVLNRIGKWGNHFYGDAEWLVMDIASTIETRYDTAAVQRAMHEYNAAHNEWLSQKKADHLSDIQLFSPDFLVDKTLRLLKAEQALFDMEDKCHIDSAIRDVRVGTLPFYFYRITDDKKKQKQQLREHDPRYFLFAQCELFK